MSTTSEQVSDRPTRHRDASECKSLIAASTKDLFRHNAFRITGLAVDATAREVIRHADKLKMLLELGQEPHAKNNAHPLDPPPTIDEIREAIQKIKDPEKRLIDEFFWFWPEEFGKSDSDPALQALAKGDTKTANEIWRKRINEESYGIVAKHNLAVTYYLIALDLGHLATGKAVSEESRLKISDTWKSSVRKWGRIQDDEKLWEKVTERIRQLNEPSLPTGFARRMRAMLPDALNKINADLIFGFAESGKIEIAKDYIAYIRETSDGQNGFKNAAETVLLPAKNLLKEQITQAVARGEASPADAANAARELLKQSRQALDLFDLFLGENSDERNELYDEVATICNRLPIAYHKATGDNKTCIEILRLVLPFVSSNELRKQIEENISVLNKNLDVEKENEIFRNLSPIKAAPELRTINGIGLTLYGSTDPDPRTGSYLTTYYFVFLMIPLFPICRYRVTRNGSSYRFFGKAPLRTCDKVHIAITIGLIITLIVMMSSSGSGSSYSQSTYSPPPQSSPYTQPSPTAPATASSGNSDGNVYRVPSSVSSSLDREKAEIETDRVALNQLGNQIDALGRQIESDRLYLDKTSQYAVDEFNTKVDRYNTLSQQTKTATAAFNERVDSYNVKLRTSGR